MKKQSVKGVARRMQAENKAAAKHRTVDSYQNFAAGMGIGADSLFSASSYGFNPITRQRTLLEWIHRGSWLGGVAVDLVANDMTRAGVTIRGDVDPTQIQKLRERAISLRLWGQINQVIKWARLYGGALGVHMVDGQDPSSPLNLDRVGKDQYKGMLVLDRWMVEPTLQEVVTDLGPELGQPKYYIVRSDAPGFRNKKIHHSRCLRVLGVELPYWQAVMENLWGISVLERLYDRMVAFDSATTGASQLTYKAWIRTYSIDGLREIIAAGGKPLQGLMQFVTMMQRFQSNEGITLLDGKDKFEAMGNGSFSGLSEVIGQLGQQLAGALQIPLVRLFGQSPGGLNSNGQSDLLTYYDGINQQQETVLRVPLTASYRMMAASEDIRLPDGFELEFNPLWQMQEGDKADVLTKITTAVSSVEESGIIKRSTALKELRQAAEVTGVFTNISDEEIEEAEAELPPAIQEALGQAQEGGEAPASATDLILGSSPHNELGDDEDEDQEGNTKDAAWEEGKHKRAGKGQKVGKSKGGQFTSKGGGGGASSGGNGAAPQKEDPKKAQMRVHLQGLEKQIRAKNPEMTQHEIAKELLKHSEKLESEEGDNPDAAGGNEGQGIKGQEVRVKEMYLGGKTTGEIADSFGLGRDRKGREQVRKMLRGLGIYKEFGVKPPETKGKEKEEEERPTPGPRSAAEQAAEALLNNLAGRARHTMWQVKGGIQRIAASGMSPEVLAAAPRCDVISGLWGYWGNMKRTLGLYNTMERRIGVAPNKGTIDTFVHEYGHHLTLQMGEIIPKMGWDKAAVKKSYDGLTEEYRQARDVIGARNYEENYERWSGITYNVLKNAPSAYGCTNVREWQAEAFTKYCEGAESRQSLKNKCPKTYEYIDKIVTNGFSKPSGKGEEK